MEDNSSKLALITGGSRGLGRNMALTLASRQIDVIITYNTQSEQADAVVAEMENHGRKAAALPLDVSNSETFADFVAQLKEVVKRKFGRENFDYLVSLSRYMAKELGGRKIRVNSIAPGAIETDFGGGVVRDNADMNRMIAGMTALGRVGLPDDIGSVVAFLCSDDSKWVNGQRIEISGGVFL